MAENHALIPEGVVMYTQTDAMKEPKDSSQNLVSGDFERQFRNRVLEQGSRRRQACFVTFAATVGVAVVWLLALTVVSQMQNTRLRMEVEQLSAHIVSLEASLNSLNTKIANNRLFNEFKSLDDDTIYADDDEQEEPLKSSDKDKDDYTTLDKLHKLTILEDEEMPDEDLTDDEDMFDESGDYYQDYDQRNENSKPGTTNMVHLTPEDFTQSLTFNKADQESLSKIRTIQRMLNENPENPDIALAAATAATLDSTGERGKRSVFPDALPELIEASQASKDQRKEENRRRSKKFPPVGSDTLNSAKALHTITRTVRDSDNEGSLIAAHFHGNTSHLSVDKHEQYKGNGLIRVAHDQAHNVWYPAPWTITAPHPRPTLTRNGHVHVHHTGVYLVYVQIYYLDSHDVISWVLHRTNADTEGRETLLQCAQSSHSTERIDKPNSCFSAAALYLRAGDRLAVRNTGGDRHSLMEPEKSFIGLVKLGDASDPYQEL